MTPADTLHVERGLGRLPAAVRGWFADDGRLTGAPVDDALAALEKLRAADLPELRLSQEIVPWLEERQRRAERKELRREYELKVHNRRMAGARDARAAVSLPARRHVASRVHRTRVAGR